MGKTISGGWGERATSRATRRGWSTGILACTWLLLVLAAGPSACSRDTSSRGHASRTQVLAFLRRNGAYQPATMRLRAVKWEPALEGGVWTVDLDEYGPDGQPADRFNLTVNAAATSYRDDTCRF